MIRVLFAHWPEYAIEALLLGIFMISACLAVAALEHPRSPLRRRFRSPHLRRAIIGVLMGLTAVALIYSPLGQRSGAHMNPGFTLAFLALGRIAPWDAAFYVLAQFVGGIAGVALTAAILRRTIRHPDVRFAVTEPGRRGIRAAWLAEFVIAFTMMSMVLVTANHRAMAPYTGMLAGLLVALFIAIEAPLSGMSMNPARTLASALLSGSRRALWVYFTAPPLAMLTAAGLYSAAFGSVYCAKLNHDGHARCIFECHIADLQHGIPRGRSGIQEGR